MERQRLQRLITKLDDMIAALDQQAIVLVGRTRKEGEACELLKDARLKPGPLADPVRDFLRSFHQVLARRQQVTTWSYNGEWFAGRVLTRSSTPPGEVEADPTTIQGPAPSEREALEKLYLTYPELGAIP